MFKPLDFLKKEHYAASLQARPPELLISEDSPFQISYDLPLQSQLELIQSSKPSRFESFKKYAIKKTNFQRRLSDKEFTDSLTKALVHPPTDPLSHGTVSEPEYALTQSAQRLKQSESNYARGKILSPKKKKYSFTNLECFESRDSGGWMDPKEAQGL
jgi:hypothetical protein